MKGTTNADRASRVALITASAAYSDPETAAKDLLADIMHFADATGIDFDFILDSARAYYADEIGQDDPRPSTTCYDCGNDFPDAAMIPRPDGGELCPRCAGKLEVKE